MSESFDMLPEECTGTEDSRADEAQTYQSTQGGVAEQIFAVISTSGVFRLAELRRMFPPDLHDRDFGIGFTAAIDRCRTQLYRVYSPQSHIEVGLYVLANDEQRLSRGRQQINTANKKMIRAVETLTIRGTRRDVALEQRRNRLLERTAFQMARRVVTPEEPLPEVTAMPRQRRPSVDTQTVEYPRVAPRVRPRTR